MKLNLKRALKSPGWGLLFVSVGIMTVSYLGARGFNYLNTFIPPKDVRNMIDGGFDSLILLCIFILYLGILLFVGSCVWILVAGILSCARKKPIKVASTFDKPK